MTFDHPLLIRQPRGICCRVSEMNRRYFKPTVNLPTTSQAQMSPEILKEVNQVVKAGLERAEETGNQGKRGKKQKYNISFTPEDRAVTGRYAIEHGNAARSQKPHLLL